MKELKASSHYLFKLKVMIRPRGTYNDSKHEELIDQIKGLIKDKFHDYKIDLIGDIFTIEQDVTKEK
jgi:hypothetical protein